MRRREPDSTTVSERVLVRQFICDIGVAVGQPVERDRKKRTGSVSAANRRSPKSC
jgi:hypothetical protein